MRLLKLLPVCAVLLTSLLLVSCRSATIPPKNTPDVPATPALTTETAVAQPLATATTIPPRTLVVCVQDEPETLYMYGGNTRSMWSLLEAVYDGPIDARNFENQAVILQKIPSLADGDAQARPVTVKAGDAIVDINGNLVELKSGTKVMPSGCNQPDCAVSYDGASEITMDQLVVTFQLLPGLKWSDGEALTVADSVFSYRLAADPATPSSKYLTDRTASYQAVDDVSAVWTGLPGFYEQRYGTFFWPPLPEHVLGMKNAAQMITDPAAARSPLGWGPFVIQEWAAGDHITLAKNPNYFRASEGLPKFDTLVYRFVGDTADGDMNALLAGECDAVDQNPQFLEMIPGLVLRETNNRLKIHVAQGPEWEHLDFGIRPASYDDGYTPGQNADRADLFGDARTRQAFAYCIDRAAINASLLYNRSSVPNSYLPSSHPLYQQDLLQYAFDPSAGTKLLDEVGWKDTDNEPATPRVAVGVAGVPDGTPLSITYQTTQAALRKQVAEAVSGNLRACGIGVELTLLNPGDLFGPGPDGIVFGRKFDLAQFSWEASARPNCLLYSSVQVPNAANYWIGANVTGYSSAEFDQACLSAYWARPTDADYAARNRAVQEMFARELPVIPLYSYVKVAIARPDLCGLEIDPTARSIFWNIEGLDLGETCP